jgi:heme-degrading monooxygenase HmoA
MSSPIVLINLFEVSAGREDEFVAWWKQCSDLLQKEPGFVDAELHQNLMPGARFQFINIAHWESREYLDQARAAHADALRLAREIGKGNPAIYKGILRYESTLCLSSDPENGSKSR